MTSIHNCWLRQRQAIKRQKETIQALKDALMRHPEIVRYQGGAVCAD